MAIEDKHLVTKILREAGAVRRCHVHTFVGNYDVAVHSFNVANLLLVHHPDPSFNLIKAALWHDAAERFTGDIPAPAKYMHPDFKSALDDIEKRIEDRLGLGVELTDDEHRWLKGADNLEFFMWCRDQIELGNITVRVSMQNVFNTLTKSDTPEPLVKELRKYSGTRVDSIGWWKW